METTLPRLGHRGRSPTQMTADANPYRSPEQAHTVRFVDASDVAIDSDQRKWRIACILLMLFAPIGLLVTLIAFPNAVPGSIPPSKTQTAPEQIIEFLVLAHFAASLLAAMFILRAFPTWLPRFSCWLAILATIPAVFYATMILYVAKTGRW